MSTVIDFQTIHVSYGKKEILHGASLQVEQGKITGIIGPNGCGKSTLIKTIYGIVPFQSGRILLEGKNIQDFSRKDIAGRLGYVGQDTSVVFDFSVEDVIGMALYNQKKRKLSSKEIIRRAMEELNISKFSGRSIQTLSGGERKMVFLARAVAQGVDTIILDEPTNHLDIRHQLFLLNYLKHSGKTIVIVIHDLRLAAHYCDLLYLMQDGQIICSGTPEQVLIRENVEQVFGISGGIDYMADGTRDFRMDFR
ncbi:MAG: ABC transporter ATP-binding protein [Lachnospiraceae bacterium]|nr:ABC transporter ATP-binding protein [Lachnospiraceae bacterium]